MKRLCTIILIVFAAFSASAATKHIPEIRWDRHSLIVDGQRVCPVMGEIHYSRMPANEWQTEIRKMREGGVTIVATYVFWNHIEEEEGVFRWDGQRDLHRFLEICQQEQMPVVLRMGPWCHGEVRNGGLPEWLFTKSCRVRSQDSTFLSYTARLYHQIFTQVQGLQWKDGGPVIAAQFDNEYRGPAEYLLALKRIALDCGFDLPFYTRTGWPELTTPMPFGEMIPLYGDYADGFWDKSTGEGVGSYYKAFNFKAFRSSTAIGTDFLTYSQPQTQNSTYPYFTCELGGGMVTAYHRRPYIYPEDAYAMALVKLGSGSNLLGYYMYHGGTNPEGRLHTLNECQTSPFTANNDLPVCTYDFQAPLGEFGQPYPQYYMLRPLHLFMHDFGALLAPMEAQFPAPQDLQRGDDTALRWSVRSNSQVPQSAFIFVNNYERLQTLSAKRDVQLEACGVKLPKLTIPSGTMAIFPINVEGMHYATAQLVAKRDGKTYLMQIPGIATTIAMQNGKMLKNIKPRGTERPIYDNLYLLTREQAEHLFLGENVERKTEDVKWTKLREAGPLRAIQKGKAKVAEAPTEEDWQQAAVYRIAIPSTLITSNPHNLLSITYRGDCARLYVQGRLVADNFYYGRPFLYGLWRLPEGCTELELRILPLQPDAPIYLPREADKRAGEEVVKVESRSLGGVAAQENISLAGTWQLTSRFDATTVTLPGSLLTNNIGDDITVDTRWTGSLYDSSYYHNPFMARYRQAGQMKFPFFLTPSKHFVGEVTYSRTINVPREWKNRRVTLFLERPHIETTVVVNGHEVGHQMSLSTPHQYDVTPYLRFGKDNDIAIRVYNGIENVCVGQDSHSVTDQTQGNWNGITGRIELQASKPQDLKTSEPPYIYRRRVITDLATGMAHITINDQTFNVHVPNARPWSEHSPQLYTAIVNYDGTPVRITFGFREVSIKGPDILLNGQRIHLRGTVGNCCFPETGYPPTDVASWERIFQKCKDYGLNHMRFHSYCPPDAAFTAADRLGFYLQPEGPSWPNHGVKLGNGMAIDEYLTSECKAILDTYGHHPSFIMLAAGNEPAGRWVDWGVQFVKTMKAHDPSRIYTTASVGGGWEWDRGSEYHVKGGARGLEWNQRQPSSDDDFTAQILHPRNYKGTADNDQPLISHEQGQWCAFPDFKEIPQYIGAYKAANFEIFRDLLAANGMAGQAEKFLMASGRLQVLAYKYEIERHLRTPHYAGFQLLSLNDYSGQGTALVGALNVHWREKGYCTAADWREFCSDVVPLAVLPRFTYSSSDTICFNTLLYNMSGSPISELSYEISNGVTTLAAGQCPVGQPITFIPSTINEAAKLTLTLSAAGHSNHWNIWVYPDSPPALPVLEGSNVPTGRAREGAKSVVICDLSGGSSLDSALIALASGHDVLLCAAGRIRYGADVVHRFLPVFWNTSWFKMRPPHTTGAYIQADHPVFRDFPTDDWQDLQWWELTNRAQCMNLAEFPADYQPIVQPIDTWHLSRKLGMMIEARVGKGRLFLTTLDITNDLDHRIVARQLRQSILSYMSSAAFQPSLVLEPEIVRHLFECEAPAVNMFTNESPDELKPKLK